MLRIVIYILTGLFLVTVILPWMRFDYWIFRIFEFPRLQKWCLNIILICLALISFIYSRERGILIPIALLVATLGYISFQIFPFTPLSSKMLKGNKDGDAPYIRFIISNVYQYNRKSEKLLKEISRHEADVMVFLETDRWWEEQLTAAFGGEYPHTLLHPLENTYGMLMYSKHPLKDAEIRFLIKEGIPSMLVTIEHPVHDVRFYSIHPEPPVPTENPRSTERDMEMLKVAKEAVKETLPTVVGGDLNDVAWSYTTARFLEVSKLYDPRIGRGMFSTFNAHYPLIWRWPLDHLFCSDHFTLNRIRCLRHVGSDHLPIYVDLAFTNLDNRNK